MRESLAVHGAWSIRAVDAITEIEGTLVQSALDLV
jgi:hypothetical protein